jgi:DNA-binding NtrC family response regulator
MNSDQADLTALTALIIDDDPNFSAALQRLLKSLDHKVLLATGAEEGLEQLEQNRVDLILLDLNMPGLHGPALLTHLGVHHPGVPVVVISGTGKVDDVVAVMKHGVVDFLRKPLDPRALDASLERVAKKRASFRQPSEILTCDERAALLEPPEALSFADEAMEDPAADVVVVLLVDDEVGYREAFRQALEGPELEVLEAPSGLHALEILGNRRVDIVVSDQMMPGMDGTKLLETVRQRWPGVGRVLLTGFPGADIFMEAVNRGGIHKALAKQLPVPRLLEEILALVNDQLALRGA